MTFCVGGSSPLNSLVLQRFESNRYPRRYPRRSNDIRFMDFYHRLNYGQIVNFLVFVMRKVGMCFVIVGLVKLYLESGRIYYDCNNIPGVPSAAISMV
jgi:hypothetical protein